VKRGFDVVCAALGLLAALPVILLLAVLVRLDSPGPGVFRQVRVGREGRPFVCLKLRTMRIDAPNVATHLAGGVHVTRLGRLLRRSKLDELPQLWNVLVGEMSLVGPRPCLPSQAELIDERRRRGVLRLRPGITGLAQVRGIDMSDAVRLAVTDADYAGRMSMRLDLAILLATVTGRAV
jgi:O-antigen biosynthesis protein WbqP